MKSAYPAVFSITAALVLLSGCGLEKDALPLAEPTLTVSVLEISPGLRRQFDVTGEVTAQQSARIVTEFRTNVVGVLVKPGESVSKGQKLLTLKSSSVNADYQTATAAYSTAIQNVEQTHINSERNVQSAEVALKTAQSNLETTLRINSAKRTQAEESYSARKINLDLSVASARTALENAIESSRVTVEVALQQVDQILELRTDRDDLTFTKETHIGVRDPTLHAHTKQALQEGFTQLQAFEPSVDYALALLRKAESVLIKSITTLSNSITSVEYTDIEHNTNVQSVTTQLSTVRSSISSLTSAQRNYESSLQMSGSNQSQILIDAKAAYQTALAEIEAAEIDAQRQVEQAKINYEAAKATASIADIAAQSNLTGVAGQLSKARIESDKLTVVAPFDGRIADLPVKSGDELNVNEHLVTVENTDLLKIVVFLSPTEVRGVSVGDRAMLSTGEELSIASKAPSADPESKKYKIEIWGQSSALHAGEFVRVSLHSVSDETDTRIFVPVSSVFVRASEVYVWGIREKDGTHTTKKIPISIGRIEGKYIEILSGLTFGDRIISEGGRTIEEEGVVIDIRSSL